MDIEEQDPEENKKFIQRLVKTMMTMPDVFHKEMFCVVVIGEDGYQVSSGMTPYFHNAIETGMIRELVLGKYRPGRVLLIVSFHPDMEEGFSRIHQVHHMFPDVRIAEAIWSDQEKFAYNMDPLTVEYLDKSVPALQEGIETEVRPALYARDEKGNLHTIDYTNPGTEVTEDEVHSAIQLNDVLSSQSQEKRDAAALDFFNAVGLLRSTDKHDAATSMMNRYAGVYLTASMKMLADVLKKLKEVKESEQSTMWWTQIAFGGVQEFSAPVYSVAASGWMANNEEMMYDVCRQRGLDPDKLAQLFEQFAEEA